MAKKKTSAQHFADVFRLFTAGATDGERAAAERKMDAWLKRHRKTRADITSILIQAAKDDEAAQPPPPPSDPRDAAPSPFDDLTFTPAGLVEGILTKYVTMPAHLACILALWICFTHVYTRFRIAPRVALISDMPESGKSTALDVARHLVLRPNPEALGTGAAIEEFLDQGPGTILLDELDHVDAEARKRLQRIWNLSHKRGETLSLKVGGRRKLIKIHAPMLAAGIGGFLAPTQKSRTFTLEMEPYTAETKPEREFDDTDVDDLNAVYIFLRRWSARVNLNPKPAMPPGVLRRLADNVKGLLAIADSCGEAWGRRAREAVTALLEKERAERPQIVLIRHGLLIFEIYDLDQIGSVQFNKELLRLDLPDARWTQYRGASGTDYLHPLRMDEQATLLGKVGIRSMRIRPPGKRQCFGYKLAQFQEAQQKHGVAAPQESELRRERLRLVRPAE
jgi:Protein of unknown function (DUF3631)